MSPLHGFRAWLQTTYASENTKRPLSPAAAGDYASRLRRLSRLTGQNVEDTPPEKLDYFLDWLSANAELRQSIHSKGVADLEVAVRRYREFLQSAIVPTAAAESLEHALLSERLTRAFIEVGFDLTGELTHVYELTDGAVTVYVKRLSNTMPIVVHPDLEANYTRLMSLSGTAGRSQFGYYHNSSMRAFPRRLHGGSLLIPYGLDLDCEESKVSHLTDLLRSLTAALSEDPNTSAVTSSRSDAEETEDCRLQKARRGQGRFRADLVDAWGGCPLSGITIPELLRASHIKPWRSSTNVERLDPNNGLLLAVHFDCLFDKGFISFADDGRLLVSIRLHEQARSALALSGALPQIKMKPGNLPYLKHHRVNVFLDSVSSE